MWFSMLPALLLILSDAFIRFYSCCVSLCDVSVALADDVPNFGERKKHTVVSRRLNLEAAHIYQTSIFLSCISF